MRTPFLALSILTLLAGPAYATKQLILIGGGGEPTSRMDSNGKVSYGTIFDSALKNTAAFTNKASDWKKEISFNGGHPDTENILRSNFKGVAASNFTVNEYKRIISKYEEQLKNGELRQGDQLLIQIDSHGAMKTAKDATHQIAASVGGITNYENLGQTTTVSLDELARLTRLAKEKGVKVAIVDSSCHSGNTQVLADENTCVISASGPTHFSYAGPTTFSGKFTEAMKPGKSLEEIYLSSRDDSIEGFPMISSPEGKIVQALLYPLLTPYLYYFAPPTIGDKLGNYIMTSENLACRFDEDFTELNHIINNVETLSSVTKASFFSFGLKTNEFEALRKSLTEYYQFQKSILDEAGEFNGSELNLVEDIRTKVGVVTYSSKYTRRELLEMNYRALISDLNSRLSRTSSESDRNNILTNIAIYQQAEIRSKELMAKYPGYVRLKSVLTGLYDKENRSRKMATNVGNHARVLYDALYKDYVKKTKATTPNPCREFIL